jgi:hypothetical protein
LSSLAAEEHLPAGVLTDLISGNHPEQLVFLIFIHKLLFLFISILEAVI